MQISKYIGVFLSAIVGLGIAFLTGPLSGFGAVVAINEIYVQNLLYQYIYSGFVASVLACLLAYLCKANLKAVTGIILSAGVLWVTFAQSGDPNFEQHLVGAVVEFMVPYAIVVFVVIFVAFGINKKWPRLN